MRTISDLQQLQALPLSLKVRLTQSRIRQWVNEFGESGVYVSFSGGKDSTVLLHIVREMYPEIPAVFCDTGLEYPEIREFVKTFDNVTWLRPKMNFFQVCEKYGFPIISKEVSENVYGARKYLTSIIESGSLDRQTDRQTVPNYAYMADILGIDRRRNKENEDFQKLKYGGLFSRADAEAIKRNSVWTTTENIEVSEELANLLNERMLNREGGSNQRLAIMLGILTNDPKHPIQRNIPKDSKSQFSKEKYQFFLAAPFEISNRCCNVMKKNPATEYGKKTGRVPITAQMASESKLRTQKWLEHGCNAFDAKKKISNPMSFWTEQDVLWYILENNLPICSVYKEIVKDTEVDGQLDLADLGIMSLERPRLKTTGCDRTGCVLCGFGCHLEKEGEGRFERLRETHPKMHNLLNIAKNNGYTYKEAIDWINEHGNLHIRY